MPRCPAGVLSHIINDRRGTLKGMSSAGGALTWSVDQGTWGMLRRVGSRPIERGDYWVETVAHDLSEARPEVAVQLCPIRFQGQWEDAESGLYYNRFRYYEPLAGQYASPDPIGVLGGERSLGYVVTPATFVDPIGLSGCCLCNVGDVGEVLASELNRGHEIGGSASSKRVLSIADNMRANGFDRNNPILAVVHGGKLYVVDGHHRLAAEKISGVNPYVQIVDPQDWIGQEKYGSMEDITGVKPPNNIRDKGKRVPC